MTSGNNNPPAEKKNNISFRYDTHYNTVSPIGQFTLQSFTNMMCDTYLPLYGRYMYMYVLAYLKTVGYISVMVIGFNILMCDSYLVLYCIYIYVLAYLTTVGYISEVNIHRAYHPLVTHNLHVRAKPLIKLPLPDTSVNNYYNITIASGGRHGHDRMVVGLTSTSAISAYHH
jgi:hypothetical protein